MLIYILSLFVNIVYVSVKLEMCSFEKNKSNNKNEQNQTKNIVNYIGSEYGTRQITYDESLNIRIIRLYYQSTD